MSRACQVNASPSLLLSGLADARRGNPLLPSFPVNPHPVTPICAHFAGTEDFNNPEIQALGRALENSTPPTRVTIFEGGTLLPLQWPRKHSSGSRFRQRSQGWKKDQPLIDALFAQQLSQARTAEGPGTLTLRTGRYAAAARDFGGLHGINGVQKRPKSSPILKR